MAVAFSKPNNKELDLLRPVFDSITLPLGTVTSAMNLGKYEPDRVVNYRE